MGEIPRWGYVAIGFKHNDLSGVSPAEIEKVIADWKLEDDTNAIDCFRKFLLLKPGDYVAVNNTNHGLFGIGVVTKGYHFELQHHNTESKDRDQWYSHLVDVDWKTATYHASPGSHARGRDDVGALRNGWRPL